MMDLLQQLAEYLATKLDMTPGKDVFYYEMPDAPDNCLCVQEVKNNKSVPAQIDAAERKIVITVRAMNNVAANELAELAYRWMWCSEVTAENPHGFLKLAIDEENGEASYVYSTPLCKPTWEKSDQRGRKYFTFDTIIITQRIKEVNYYG